MKTIGKHDFLYLNKGMRYRDYLAIINFSFGKQYNIGIKVIAEIIKSLG